MLKAKVFELFYQFFSSFIKNYLVGTAKKVNFEQ